MRTIVNGTPRLGREFPVRLGVTAILPRQHFHCMIRRFRQATSVQSEQVEQLLALSNELGRGAVARAGQVDFDQPRPTPLFAR